METKVTKGKNGWEAETSISMGPATERHGDKVGERVLTIRTSKGYGPGKGIDARASVALHLDGWVQHVIGYGTPGGDFSQRILRSGAKCTEKAVRALHEEAITHADAILADARDHYAAQKALA